MKIRSECVPCLIKRVIFEAEQSTSDEKKKTLAIKNACRILSDIYDPVRCSAEIATIVHKEVYEILADKDPYLRLKEKSNAVARQLIPRVEELINKSNNPLKTSMLCSIIGNSMDYGIEGGSNDPEMFKNMFEELYVKGLGHDDFAIVKTYLEKVKRICFFTDNCGEIVFDKILCRELKKAYPNLWITLVVKGESILSDATIKDVEALHFLDVVDEILNTGCYAVGINFSFLPEKLEEALNRCDLIICKGMANYESFSETMYRPIVYLLRTKCNAIASSMNLPININAIKVYK
ncbi:MAG: ARMT1-like domain-containing protein [Thermoplasmatota archaeon]